MVIKFLEDDCKQGIAKAKAFSEDSVKWLVKQMELSEKQQRAVIHAIKRGFYEGYLCGLKRGRE